MVTVIKNDNIGNITIDGTETNISKQNDKYKDHKTSKKFAELTGYFRSRINPKTAEIERGLKEPILGDIVD
ncbi:2537_t:CDS:2 [Funneliformis geosporum]|uniref:2269_t:CDS:1 n=1 Tax=Funneliformis geosporum TaxID=1117311 RepID=A0A9W4SWX2_9GLOM|nr:2269_t:CDS:2 [Funneliformis geosporum]CAI2188229.1 2537_t:CDS:2 [Funneliformis geosporum]